MTRQASGFAPGALSKRNLGTEPLLEQAVQRGEGRFANTGAFVVTTGKITGRSPQHKFFVKEETTADRIWWGNNKEMTEACFARLKAKMFDFLDHTEHYVQDLRVGADSSYSINVRVVNQLAWHSLFARTMFIRTSVAEQQAFEPDFTIINCPSVLADPATDGTVGATFIAMNLKERLVLIGGTEYAGETKKSVFTIMNYLMPVRGVLSMHCSANIGANGDPALFFGLSGTGKTTLSADPSRGLVGDDEHCWSDAGIFNIEGGCYAKCINLSREAEPLIFDAIRYGSVVENVVMDPANRGIDYADGSLTENTRCAYPLEFIPNAVLPSVAHHPKDVVFLTCDAHGVLPPISRLTPAQAMYQFLLGYTAKVAGTETGITEPTLTFSPCFGAPFLPLHPTEYARLLGERIRNHQSRCWLVNTGWSGGPFGVGHRMAIAHTRRLVNAALAGELDHVGFEPDPIFGLAMPRFCPGLPAEILNPRNTWKNQKQYEDRARFLAGEFAKNFEKYSEYADAEVRAAGPKLGA